MLLLPVVLFLTSVNASLINHGNGLVYDSDRDITWLSNANLAGQAMTWEAAGIWVDDLVYADATDWRLPMANDKDGSGLLPTSSSQAYSDLIKGDLRHLFSIDLGGILDPGGTNTSNYGNYNSNADLFTNIVFTLGRDDVYWTSEPGSISGRAYYFGFSNGGQWQKYISGSQGLGLAWAVHDGVLGKPVPEPATLLLLSLGFLGLGASRNKFL